MKSVVFIRNKIKWLKIASYNLRDMLEQHKRTNNEDYKFFTVLKKHPNINFVDH